MKKEFFIVALLLLFSCENKDINVIDTIALVVPRSYHGSIIIFYNQLYEKGKIEFRNGKHFIYVPEDGIVFTKYKLGDGRIEKYDESLVERDDYGNVMNPQLLNDEVYDVIGGGYGGFDLSGDESSTVRFSLFRAGLGKEIKRDTSLLFDLNVRKTYEKALMVLRYK